MIAGHTFKVHIKQEASSLASSPVGVLIATIAIFSLGLTGCLYATETLLIPLLFSAFMFPALFSAILHMPLRRISIQDYLNAKHYRKTTASAFHA
jgi:hypothetical protein